jgi:hypothetical protein
LAAPLSLLSSLKAMAEFMDSSTMEDMLVAFERVRTVAHVSSTGGQGFFQEFKTKVAPQLDYKRGHLLRVISKKQRTYESTPGVMPPLH